MKKHEDEWYATRFVKTGVCPICGQIYGYEVLSHTGEVLFPYSYCDCEAEAEAEERSMVAE